jgi:hypothetical protein
MQHDVNSIMGLLIKALMDIKGFQYEIFTSFEEAVEWLSDITVLAQP